MSAVPGSYEKTYTYEAMGRVSIKGQSLNAGINLFGSYSLGVSRDGVSSSVGISTTPGVSISYMDSYTTSDELEKYEFTNGEGYRINNATYDYNQKGGLFATPDSAREISVNKEDEVKAEVKRIFDNVEIKE